MAVFRSSMKSEYQAAAETPVMNFCPECVTHTHTPHTASRVREHSVRCVFEILQGCFLGSPLGSKAGLTNNYKKLFHAERLIRLIRLLPNSKVNYCSHNSLYEAENISKLKSRAQHLYIYSGKQQKQQKQSHITFLFCNKKDI